MRSLICLAILAPTLLASCATIPSADSRFSRFEALIEERQDDAAFERILAERYRQDFTVDRLSRAQFESESTEALNARFRAAHLAIFYTATIGRDEIESVFAQLKARKAISAWHVETLFATLVQTRELEKARALQDDAGLPAFQSEPLPEELDHTGGRTHRRFWEVDHNALRVVRHSWVDEVQVLVAAHPLCHFSQDAGVDIAADPKLAALFRKNALWLTPQGGRLDLQAIQEWNRRFPQLRQRIVYQRRDWPEVSDWSTPNFYFFRDGKVVATVTGWPQGGRRDELLAAARAAGLIQTDTPSE